MYMHMSIHIYYLLLHYHQALTLDNILFTFLFLGLFEGGHPSGAQRNQWPFLVILSLLG